MEAINSVARYNWPCILAEPEEVDEYNEAWDTFYENPLAKGFNESEGDDQWLRFSSDYRERQRIDFFRTR